MNIIIPRHCLLLLLITVFPLRIAAAEPAAVTGRNETDIGVYGETENSAGASGSFGVVGVQAPYSTEDYPATFWAAGGYFAGDNGVTGVTNDPGGYGVFGYNAASERASGYAARFISVNGDGARISSPDGTIGLRVSGGILVVDNGTKNALVQTSQGPRLLYVEESTEVVFTDYGFGRLQDGTARIDIDPLFAETVNLDEPYHVFVQPYGDAEVYVDERSSEGFVVVARDGRADVEFSYRIVAKRLGFESDRLESAPVSDMQVAAQTSRTKGKPQARNPARGFEGGPDDLR